ncbi:hypothetical protein GGR25_003919 [Kaistia hirudinis]|uniref:Aspartyl protease n=1 Tax=Kaistia hirudinis TaxID=1293440 RepID=A0A840AWT0_9HYPH|nr:hypothetical protein [Kaistia hirudinis]MBB3932855.1 hypothetical protein [Kaistia hirudinis]
MMSFRRLALALLPLLIAAPASAQEVSRPDYSAFSATTFLRFLNARDGEIRRSPHVGLSFGGRTISATLDTGSTGVVVAAALLPNFDQLPVIGDGKLTYTSSGRIMLGQWVTTPLTLVGADGASVTTAPMPVLAITRIACTETARRCEPSDDPRHTAMVGIGFGRERDAQAQSTRDKNPLLQITSTANQRRGYVVTAEGIHIGLTSAAAEGDFRFIKLKKMNKVDDWAGIPACISIGGQMPAACGSMLVDTGVGDMYMTAPPAQAPAVPLPDGTAVSIAVGDETASTPLYDFKVGDVAARMAPDRIFLHTSDERTFVNTGFHFLYGFDYLYDADGGYAAFRRR